MTSRREFLEASVLATVFPFTPSAEAGDKGYWDLHKVTGDKITFVRYDGRGERCASCVISGEVGSWEIRRCVFGGKIEHSDEFTDRAAALDDAVSWMQSV